MTTVLCPLDATSASERALASACDLADLRSAQLELFSAVEDPHMVRRRQDYLAQLIERARCESATTTFATVVVDPHAPQAIAKRSRDSNVVTVMATSTRPLLHDGYLGSAAERAVREAARPLLLVGPRSQIRLRDVQRVVVPCDGSALSETALPEAHQWATMLGVELWVVTAGREHLHGMNETNYVRRLAQPVGAQWEVLHHPEPAVAITDWAGSALIVMTTHGRSGLKRLTVGSVTAQVARRAMGPILALHQQPTS